MGLVSKFKRFFELEDDHNENEIAPTRSNAEEHLSNRQDRKNDKSNVVSLPMAQKTAKVLLIEPTEYEEVQEIADQLKNRKAIVINLQRIPYDQGLRIVDFLSGTVYAIGGDIQKLGPNIFICTPDNVDITGSISDYLQE